MTSLNHQILDALTGDQSEAFIQEWLNEGKATASLSKSAPAEAAQIVASLAQGLKDGASLEAVTDSKWAPLQDVLSSLSRSRAAQGLTAGETSVFVLALKKPLLSALQKRLRGDSSEQLAAAFWSLTKLVDGMAQYTATTFQLAREEIISRQQEELLELSTPVVKLWEGVLAVPMIGTLDSNRTQIVMETLLQKIVETGSELAIIDITGVPTVDTLVAQHLLKTVTAIRLMGADCIISGIRPQIAQTIVHLGIDLQGISTKASLADALSLALQRTGWRITRQAA
ncbi:MAG: STAS domain-containing protein [Gammaproteobacteria bacterium]|nr:STAS domain-containing protein [Gammaproteobacteria bacterium]MBU1351551.1 STAS domain-containing protein [Gammaproteobacteria bacterium]MBU2122099.1 STAS domain-containing protein [Gammaproteobacteria bacterium]MBU2170114.1 STAS domain-containing protein [Gammaproteobacteria bacterium]MBU2202674.1 STAS domain-containing protein [Gammaproteobacteria bacterium]